MSRWLDREEEKAEPSGVLESLSRSGAEKRERVEVQTEAEESFGANNREPFVLRGRTIFVRASEREALYELGRFRVAFESDLVRGVYGGQSGLAKADLRALSEKHLV